MLHVPLVAIEQFTHFELSARIRNGEHVVSVEEYLQALFSIVSQLTHVVLSLV